MGWLTPGCPGCLRHLIPGLSVRSLVHITYHTNPNLHGYFTSCPHLRVTVHQHGQQRCVGSGEGDWESLGQMLCWSGNSRPEQGTLLFLFFFFFYNSHSDRCEVISHWGLDFHFLEDYWSWASFHVPPGDLPNPGTEPRSPKHCKWILLFALV